MISNIILNEDRTWKNAVSVSRERAESEGIIDIQPTDIFIENCPQPQTEMVKPKLLVNWEELLQAAIDAEQPAPEVWEEAASQAELDAIQLEKAKQLAASQLHDSDKDMARIAEDFYDYMMANDANFATAMPQSVHNKIAERKALRAKL